MSTSSAGQVPNITFLDGVAIPQLGFGVFQVEPEETEGVLEHAFEAGYRHVDTAKIYGNEAEVGNAVRASGLSRDELFVTTKCWNSDQGYDNAKAALHKSLELLQLDFVDLYLIHWPVPSEDLYVETWKAFVDLQAEGLIRSIGVSNFQPDHLDRIVEETGVTPSTNQIELHPRLQQPELRRKHQQLSVVTEAWSPLAQGAVLDDPDIKEIADAHGKTAGQVVLRWHIQLGNVVFPKSSTPERIRENFQIFDFELTGDQMAAIEPLDKGERVGPDPDVFGS